MRGNCKPQSWSLVLVVLVTFCVLEDISRLVSLQTSTALLAPIFGLVAVGNYVYRLGRYVASGTSLRKGESSRGIWRWFVLPAGLALVVSALVEPWPMTVRFSLSQQAFEQKVAEMQTTHTNQSAQRVGLYWIRGAYIEASGYMRFVTGTSVLDPAGFAYDPKRPPSGRLQRHITGNWYATEW